MRTHDKCHSYKGQVFTTDSMLAVLLVALFASMAVSASIQQKSLRGELSYERFAEDALITLDRTNVLASNNGTLISNTLSALAPQVINWSLNITTYSVNGTSLQVIRSITYGGNASIDEDMFVSQRRFASYSQSGEITNVSVARMEVW